MQGAGTYMFRIDDKRVIDATRAGSIAHLINHSCEVCSINSIYTTIACFLRNILLIPEETSVMNQIILTCLIGMRNIFWVDLEHIFVGEMSNFNAKKTVLPVISVGRQY